MLFRNIISLAITIIISTMPVRAAQDPASVPLPAQAAEPFQPVDLARMEGLRRDLTLRFLGQFRDPGLRSLLAARLGPDQTRVPLTRLVTDWAELWPTPERRQFAARIRELDLELRQRMGIEDTARTLLELRVV